MSYIAEPLGDHHDLSSFDSGNGELDDWLRLHAVTARGQGTRTYVVVNEAGSVVGYFAIAPHTIDRGELSRLRVEGRCARFRRSSSPSSHSIVACKVRASGASSSWSR